VGVLDQTSKKHGEVVADSGEEGIGAIAVAALLSSQPKQILGNHT
jgi:hypothetical protein